MISIYEYEFIINNFPWVSITPTLHKLLAHTPELIRDYNACYGYMKTSCFLDIVTIVP